MNLISPLSKIIEKVWSKQILEHLKVNKLIDNNHQGSLKGRNGSTLLNEIYHNLTIMKKNRKTGAIISLDQSAAFDLIPHCILEKKLKKIGISEKSTKMLMSDLKSRKQRSE